MKKSIALVLIFLALCLFGDKVFGSDFKISPPTTNEDGSPILPYPIGYFLYCGNKSGQTDPTKYTVKKDAGVIDPSADGICRYPINQVLPAGSTSQLWYCSATAYYSFDRMKESRFSNEIFFIADGGGNISDVRIGGPGLGFEK